MSEKPIWLPAPGLTYIGTREAAVISYHNRQSHAQDSEHAPEDAQSLYIEGFRAGMRWERALMAQRGLAGRIQDALRVLTRGY